MLKIPDYILIVTLLIFAVTFNFFYVKVNTSKSADFLVASVDGEEIDRYPLSVDGEFTLETGKDHSHINVFKIQDGEVSMIDANCPDKYCVQTKPIEYNTQTIVCLPNKVVLEIYSDSEEKEPEIDSFVQ